MRRLLFVFFTLLAPAIVFAAQYSGTVRAADQFLPGATVTARLGGAKVVGYTDEEGRFSLDLAPGVWDIEVSIFGFTPVHGKLDIADRAESRDWVLEMPRFGERAQPAPVPAVPAAAAPVSGGAPRPAAANPAPRGQSGGRRGGFGAQAGRGGPGGRGGNGQPQPQAGFQNVSVTATEEGQQELAAAALPAGTESENADFNQSYTLIGSSSGGLQAGAEEQVRRDRTMAGRGGQGGPGGPGGDLGVMSAAAGLNFNGVPGGDGLGMSGFGAAGAAAGFGADNGGGFGPAGGGGARGGGGGGGGRGGGGGGGGRGGGGRNGFNGGRQGRNGRAPFNGQFMAFGNRRRVQPAYTGSVVVNANNSALNAAPFSLNGQVVPKPSSQRVSVSGNIGGPLRIPKLVKNDKWFVYLTLQGTWNHAASQRVGTLPTAAERSGDFSQATIRNTPITIFDPDGSGPFPGNVIPSARFSSASAGLLQYFPLPTSPLALQNYTIGISNPNDSHAVGVRLSGSVSSKDRLNFNEQYSGNHSNSEQLFGFLDTGSGYGMSSTAGWSHSFKPRFNNSVNFSFSRSVSKSTPYFAYGENVAQTLGITGTDQEPIDYGPPNLSFTNFSWLADGTASVNRSQTANFTDTVTYVVRRKHNLQFGFGYRRMQQNALSYANSRGSFSFSGLLTSQLDAGGQPQQGTGMDFADFLLGLPQSSSVRINNSNNYFRGWALNWYAQDDFRVGRGLTLNFGLRYEYFAPYTELRGRLANLDLNPTMTAVAQVTALDPQGVYSGNFPASLVNPDKNNYSPRFGFAWRPTQKHSRVIHGGYSIFYSGSAYGAIAARMAAQPPFAVTASLTTSSDNLLTLANGFALLPSQTITNTYAVDKNYRLAYAQTWAFAVQQTLPHNLLAEVEYIGTKGTGLDVQEQPNRAVVGSPLNAAQNLQIANATGFTYETSQANSIYHAGQVRLTRRFSRGMSAMALYTFSKSIDDASTFSGGGSGTLVQNPFDLSAERGLSTFDHRHNLSLTYMASSPVGVHGLWRNGGWKTKAFTGWTLQGTFTANSGAPLTAYVSGNIANIGGIAAFGNSRAEATGLPIRAGGYPYFNQSAFTTPGPGEFGNAGRDTIPGPLVIGLNSSLNRAWRFGETRRQLQVRISANNVLNHVEITGWGTTVNAATYGLPTAASGTRTVQLMMRLNF